MANKDKSILALGSSDRWIINRPRWITVSLAGFLFWSAIIAAVRQLIALLWG